MEKDSSGHNPFTVPLGMLLYRVARKMWTDQKLAKSALIRTLLENCLCLLDEKKHSQVNIASVLLNNWGVRGRVVRIVDLESLAPHSCPETLDSFMWGSYSANLQNWLTSVVADCVWNKAWRGTLGLPPLGKLESCCITLTVLAWCKNQLKNSIKLEL